MQDSNLELNKQAWVKGHSASGSRGPSASGGRPGGFASDGFWSQALRFLRFAGRQVLHKALLLYYAAQNPRTPKWARTAIYGALLYFVSPLDVLPDLLPGVGYTDDLWVLAAALATVSFYVDETVRARAEQRFRRGWGARTIRLYRAEGKAEPAYNLFSLGLATRPGLRK